ncbi:hypothetical protein TK34_03680 [Aeromonas hydrophila]|nr:hypothetical protein TK34_03680 [Aeromonas hydrophila]
MPISQVDGWDFYHAQLRMNINPIFRAGFDQITMLGLAPIPIWLTMPIHPSGPALSMLRPRLPQDLGCSTLCVPRLLVWIY